MTANQNNLTNAIYGLKYNKVLKDNIMNIWNKVISFTGQKIQQYRTQLRDSGDFLDADALSDSIVKPANILLNEIEEIGNIYTEIQNKTSAKARKRQIKLLTEKVRHVFDVLPEIPSSVKTARKTGGDLGRVSIIQDIINTSEQLAFYTDIMRGDALSSLDTLQNEKYFKAYREAEFIHAKLPKIWNHLSRVRELIADISDRTEKSVAGTATARAESVRNFWTDQMLTPPEPKEVKDTPKKKRAKKSRWTNMFSKSDTQKIEYEFQSVSNGIKTYKIAFCKNQAEAFSDINGNPYKLPKIGNGWEIPSPVFLGFLLNRKIIEPKLYWACVNGDKYCGFDAATGQTVPLTGETIAMRFLYVCSR
jgi:hypothetical protein